MYLSSEAWLGCGLSQCLTENTTVFTKNLDCELKKFTLALDFKAY